MDTVITFVVYLAILAIAVSLIWYILQNIPLPPPLSQWVNMAVVVIGGILLIMLLVGLARGGLSLPRLT